MSDRTPTPDLYLAVFQTDAGQQLLDRWRESYCAGLCTADALASPAHLAAKAAVSDFVHDITAVMRARMKQLEKETT